MVRGKAATMVYSARTPRLTLLGVRFGKEQLGVSAEVGVFYHRSRSGARPSNVIVVPALVLHGQELIRAIRDATGGGPRHRR